MYTENSRQKNFKWQRNKEMLKSLAIREMQIRMTPRFNLTPVTMVRIKNTSDRSC